jgi:Ca2+-binding RTX toxin-like protein
VGKRRLTSILMALAFLSTGGISSPGNAGDVPSPPNPIGPIVADLFPPTSRYYVEDAEDTADYYYEVYWDETTAGDPSPAEFYGHDPEPQSCGTFYPNTDDAALPARSSGDLSGYRENYALWDHPNGTGPGLCPHSGTDHPGLVIADVYESYDPTGPGGSSERSPARGSGDDYDYPPLPDKVYHCEYEGSEEGIGDPCVLAAEPVQDYCRFHVARLVIYSLTGALIRVEGDDVIATLAGGAECVVPTSTLQRITVLGGAGNDSLSVDWPTLLGTRISVNLGEGANTLSLTGSDAIDWFGFHGIPASPGFEGGFAFDFNKDNRPDFSAMNVQNLNVDLGAGNDTVKVFPEYLYPQYSAYSLAVDGGQGTDKAMLLPSAAGRYSFGTDPAQPSVANVNLDSNTGDVIDVMGTGLEIWVPQGSPAVDVFTGAGGAGTGGPFQFKLRMSGGGGNDRLIGGAKDDTLNGGAGNNDVCKGGKGTDTATGCETKRSIPKSLLP